MTVLTAFEAWLSDTRTVRQDGDAPAAGWDLWLSDVLTGDALVTATDQSLSVSDSASSSELIAQAATATATDALTAAETVARDAAISASEAIGLTEGAVIDTGSPLSADIAAQVSTWLSDTVSLDTAAATNDAAWDTWLSDRRSFAVVIPSAASDDQLAAASDAAITSETAAQAVATAQTEAVSLTEGAQVQVASGDVSSAVAAQWDTWLSDVAAQAALAATAPAAWDAWISGSEALATTVETSISAGNTRTDSDGGTISETAALTIAGRMLVTWAEFEVPAAGADSSPTATDAGTLGESAAVVATLGATDAAGAVEQATAPNVDTLEATDAATLGEAQAIDVQNDAPPTFGADADEATLTETAVIVVALIDQDGTVAVDAEAFEATISASRRSAGDASEVVRVGWDQWVSDGVASGSLAETGGQALDAWLSDTVAFDALPSPAAIDAPQESDAATLGETAALSAVAIDATDALALAEALAASVVVAALDGGSMRERSVSINDVVVWPPAGGVRRRGGRFGALGRFLVFSR